MLTKKHFIELADSIRAFNDAPGLDYYTESQIEDLADFCQSQNPRFNRELWLGYIAGTRGPGGKYL